MLDEMFELDSEKSKAGLRLYITGIWRSVQARRAGQEQDIFIKEVASNYHVSQETLVDMAHGRI